MTARQIGQLVLLSALWGGVFLLVKYALVDFSAVEVAFLRAVVGAVGLFVIVNVEGGEARAKLGDILRRPGPAILLGACAIAGPFMLISLGELTVPSGLAGVLASTTPMFVALFAPFLDRETEVNRVQAAGLVVGLFGVALVLGAHFLGSAGQFLGALALVGAAVGGALSSFIVKEQYTGKGVPASTTSFFALVVGAVLTLPVAVATAPRELPGMGSVLAVLALGLICTSVGWTLYFSLIDKIGSERASLATYLTPAFALFYGVLLLGESLTVSAIVGLVLIVSGAEITLRGGARLKARYRIHPPSH